MNARAARAQADAEGLARERWFLETADRLGAAAEAARPPRRDAARVAPAAPPAVSSHSLRYPGEPMRPSWTGNLLAEARAVAAALRVRAEGVLRLDLATPHGRAAGVLEIAALRAGVRLLAAALARAGKTDAAARVAEAADGAPRAVLQALADRSVAGELE